MTGSSNEITTMIALQKAWFPSQHGTKILIGLGKGGFPGDSTALKWDSVSFQPAVISFMAAALASYFPPPNVKIHLFSVMAKRHAEDYVLPETTVKFSRSLTNEEQGSVSMSNNNNN